MWRSRGRGERVSERVVSSHPTDRPRAEAGEKSLERQVRAYHWIRLLAELPGRRAGSEAEREAGSRVAGWLHNLGLDETSFQSVPSRPQPGAAVALHLGLGALACLLGGVPGLLLAGVAALSWQRERQGCAGWLSRLLPAPDSQNLVARVGATRPRRRVVLIAHLDTQPASRLLVPFAERCAERGRDPQALFGHALLAAFVVCAASALGADGWLVGLARAAGVLGLGVGALAGLEALRAPGSPGANASASGVAALLTCTEQLAAQLPPDVELWCAATGAGEVGGCGVRELVAAHPDWISDRTAFVLFGALGGGELCYLRSEGGDRRCAYPPMLGELARRVAASGAFSGIAAVDLPTATAGGPIAASGGQLLSLMTLEATGLPRNAGRADDRPEQVDTESVIRAADFAASVVSAHLRGDAEPLAYV